MSGGGERQCSGCIRFLSQATIRALTPIALPTQVNGIRYRIGVAKGSKPATGAAA